MKAKVMIVAGSLSDRELIEECVSALTELKVPFEVAVASAHRTPSYLVNLVKRAERNGVQVFIAIAGGAAHLPGVIASHTIKPVIGVPAPTKHLSGLDSLLSIVQMPRYVPVASVSIGNSGAYNAGLLAGMIVALSDPDVTKSLKALRRRVANEVRRANEDVRGFGRKGGKGT